MLRTSSLLTAFIASVAVVHGDAGPLSIADAAMRGDRADVLALIKQGADVNAPQGDGVTALHWAARQATPIWSTALVAAGANARARDAVRRVHAAAPRGRARLGADRRRRSSRAGATVDAKTSTGATPLMFAAARRRHGGHRGAPRRRRERQRAGDDRLPDAADLRRREQSPRRRQAAHRARRRSERRDEAHRPGGAQPQRREPRRPQSRGQARSEAARRRRGSSSPASSASTCSTSRWRGRAA